MAEYRITGVWKNADNVITHYAFHKVNENSTDRADKISKARAIEILETSGNSAYTWLWNYSVADSKIGE